MNESGATFSPCEKYRYHLWRIWDDERPILCWIMLERIPPTNGIGRTLRSPMRDFDVAFVESLAKRAYEDWRKAKVEWMTLPCWEYAREQAEWRRVVQVILEGAADNNEETK